MIFVSISHFIILKTRIPFNQETKILFSKGKGKMKKKKILQVEHQRNNNENTFRNIMNYDHKTVLLIEM